METYKISGSESSILLNLNEGHFADIKSIDIKPSKLTKSISAFANAEGGELYVGIEDNPREWIGFENDEAANGHIQCFEELFPHGTGFDYSFLECDSETGLVLKIEIDKNRNIIKANDGKYYIRRGAQSLPISNEQGLEQLKRCKGLTSFENETVNVELDVIENSEHIIEFMLKVVPESEPITWLKKQRVIIDSKPTVSGLLLFAEEPQAILQKHCGLKIYQYGTKEEGERETLQFDPITIEGNLYNQIYDAVNETTDIIEAIRIMTPNGLINAKYPKEALHEIITNAIIHRDYSVTDDVHVRIFNNRIEVESPGVLPAHITPENILKERFARNGTIVRLINKFPEPPNKDVGEGLQTAFRAMKNMRLSDPLIQQKQHSVLVVLKHESLGTPQELIMEYLDSHENITNKIARDLCNVGSENAMKHILKRMVGSEMLLVNKGKTIFDTSYSAKRNP